MQSDSKGAQKLPIGSVSIKLWGVATLVYVENHVICNKTLSK